MENLTTSPPTILGICAFVIGSIVSLVVWLLKNSQRRQDAITDRFFAYLEAKDRDAKALIEMFGGNMERIGEQLDEHTKILRHVAEDQSSICQAKAALASKTKAVQTPRTRRTPAK